LAALFIVLFSLVGCREESAKWNFASAMNLAESGQAEEAIEVMELAFRAAPDNRQIKLAYANLLAENDQGELGITLCDEILELTPEDKLAHQIRSTCFQYLGEFDLALENYKRHLSGKITRTPIELNNLAYFRTLARKELSRANRDINSAIDSEETEYWGCSYIVPLEVRTAVAIGLLSRTLNQRDRALEELNKKIDDYETKLERQTSFIQSIVTQLMQENAPSANPSPARGNASVEKMDSTMNFSFGEKLEKGIHNARALKQIDKNSLGVMLATRALLNEDIGDLALADRDRRRLEQLELNFTNLAAGLPSAEACLTQLQKASMYLDTRGFVSGRRNWKFSPPANSSNNLEQAAVNQIALLNPIADPPSSYVDALTDLDCAILASEFMELALKSSLYNTPDFSAQQIAQRQKMATRMTAVLIYHRMEIHRRAGKERAADQDRQIIENLGFEADGSLF
jgi:tetratricopeptide (TPR) repeat protein